MKYVIGLGRFLAIVLYLISQAAPKFLWIAAIGLFATIVTNDKAAIMVMFIGLWFSMFGLVLRMVWPNLIKIVGNHLNV